ncbi:MAG TPA: hypothetical protein QKA14_02780 [Candidatus Megaira endosymbiont of Hartmannula sinica]|nr:hypothetical protein [Candidatus Megaera endosymbiont of Hartmannula sinica]
MTTLTKQDLVNIAEEVEQNINLLQQTIKSQKEEIVKLKTENNSLVKSNQTILTKIKIYTEELENIKKSLCR